MKKKIQENLGNNSELPQNTHQEEKDSVSTILVRPYIDWLADRPRYDGDIDKLENYYLKGLVTKQYLQAHIRQKYGTMDDVSLKQVSEDPSFNNFTNNEDTVTPEVLEKQKPKEMNEKDIEEKQIVKKKKVEKTKE